METLKGRMDTLSTALLFQQGANDDVHARIAVMSDAYNRLFRQCDRVQEAFEKSEAAASRSGKLIETLCLQKKRAQAAKELFTIFCDIAGGKGTAKLDAVLGLSADEARSHGADLMRRLVALGKAGIADTDANKTIAELAEGYEKRLLEEFKAAFHENNLAVMRQTSSMLVRYNGGTSCVDWFVSQHQFFHEPIHREHIVSATHPTMLKGPIDLGSLPKEDPLLTSMFNEIANTVEADWNYLGEVFESPTFIMNVLMQRIFKEIVHVYVDEILLQARNHSNLTYLRTLYASHQATKDLLEKMRTSYTHHIKDICSRMSKVKLSLDSKLASVDVLLDSLMIEVFAEHLKIEPLIALEMNTLNDLLNAATFHLQNAAAARKSSTKVINSISSVFTRGGATSPQSAASPGDFVERLNSLFIFADGKPLVPTDMADPVIVNSKVIKHCLALHSETMGRLFTMLTFAGDSRGLAMNQSLKLLLSLLMERYMELSLELVMAMDASEIYSKGFSAHSFTAVQAVCNVLGAVLLYYQEHVIPLVVLAAPTILRRVIEAKADATGRVTDKIDLLLKKECDGASKFVEELLSKQKKTDYRPKAEDIEALMGSTQACQAICDFVANFSRVVIDSLDTSNATTLLIEFGSRLHLQLLEHLKNYVVSDTGAMVLQNDLKRYKALVDVMKPASEGLKERFEMLWELGHVFVVRPENLRSILQEGYLGRLDIKLIYPYITMRADFSSAKIDKLFPDMAKSFTRLFALNELTNLVSQ